MSSNTISATNLGPIDSLEFSLREPGVTVLVAPNGSGKSILLEAVQAAAKGEGKVPLRDRTRKGQVSAFGAVITIGGTCRHGGSFEVSNLEGRFDLAALVDPRIKTPAAADKARIKALVALTGVAASVNLFRQHELFQDFDTVVSPASIQTDDLVEMAAKIKDDYDRAALQKERYADHQSGQASALTPPADLDLDEESDADILQSAYNEARDTLTRLQEQQRNAKATQKSIDDAQTLLNELGDKSLLDERSRLEESVKTAEAAIQFKKSKIDELKLTIRQLEAEVTECSNTIVSSEVRLKSIQGHMELVDKARATISQSIGDIPEQSDIDEAEAEVAIAKTRIETGAKIRAALEALQRAKEHRAAATAAQDRANLYRDAGKATDEVLSSCIKCPQLRVESDGKSARLVTDTARGTSIPYHDLSEGERWTLAIDIGADQVGAGGLLVISQVGWEGIDGKNRIAIHQHAVDRGVYILTAEAAADPEATREIIPTPMPHVEPTMSGTETPPVVPPAAKPPVSKPPAETSVKPEITPPPAKAPAKASSKPPAAKPPAAKKPDPPTFNDEDDIPF